MVVRAGTASQVKTWWSMEDFDYMVNCYECNTQGHIRRNCPSRGQPSLAYSNEEFNYTVNPAGPLLGMQSARTCEEKCPDLGQSGTRCKGGKDEEHLLLQLFQTLFQRLQAAKQDEKTPRISAY